MKNKIRWTKINKKSINKYIGKIMNDNRGILPKTSHNWIKEIPNSNLPKTKTDNKIYLVKHDGVLTVAGYDPNTDYPQFWSRENNYSFPIDEIDCWAEIIV